MPASRTRRARRLTKRSPPRKASDVAIIVAGVEEGEFRDRAKLGLPGRQAELIEAVAATGKPTVVVLIGGSAITMPWLDQRRRGARRVVSGRGRRRGGRRRAVRRRNPAGRLPITFPVSEGQLPLYYNHKPTGRGDDYVDLTGMALFPFGFGLSYTTFEYSDLVIEPAEMPASGTATIRFTVREHRRASGRRSRAALRARRARVGRAAGDGAQGFRAHAARAAASGAM